MLAVTLDVDWAPDQMVEHLVRLLDSRGIPVTVFCTDPVTGQGELATNLARLASSSVELGWHPYFVPQRTPTAVVESLHRQYPDALGWKSHQGLTGWPLQQACVENGIKYEILTFATSEAVRPYRPYAGIDYTLLHNNFTDAECLKRDGYRWAPESVPFIEDAESNSLYVMTFHPHILYYNLTTNAEYLAGKPGYHRMDERAASSNRDRAGPMSLLLDLIAGLPQSCFTTPGRYLGLMKEGGT
ncbi:MAG: hypothetical protein JWO51_4233 [Rhodospirillales bacterium]|nr:hypothetical protein [Rhodospirillales bacterium]